MVFRVDSGVKVILDEAFDIFGVRLNRSTNDLFNEFPLVLLLLILTFLINTDVVPFEILSILENRTFISFLQTLSLAQQLFQL